MQQTRVLIGDPADLARQGLRGLLSTQEDLEVVASCKRVDEVVSESIARSPDVALLGYGFSEPQRLDALRQIVKNRPWIPVLVLTDHPELEAFLSCVKAGARGYLGGSVDASGLVEAVRTLISGGCAMESSILLDLFAYLSRGSDQSRRPLSAADKNSPMARLTPREREVLRLMAQGRANKEIGALLGISVGTAKTHLRHIFRKLQVSDRTGAVLTALEIDASRLLPAA
jgi:DNA-binding NarL/FixJ family response regulator